MTNGYSPLFNRKYLIGLMWFCLFAILILSSMGPDDAEYHSIEHNKSKTVYWMELDEQPIILAIQLPTPPALNPQQQQLQQLKAQVAKSILDSSPRTFSYRLTAKQDRIEINLGWASGQTSPDVSKLLQELQQPFDGKRWQTHLEKLQARDYLQNKNTEAQLIKHFMEGLQPTNSSTPLQQLNQSYLAMFHNPRFAISGEDAEEVSEELQEQLTASETLNMLTETVNPSLPTGSINITANDDKYHLLFGQTIATRNSPEFLNQRLTAQILQDLLLKHAAQYDLEYRLLSTSLHETGYRAIILHGAQNPAAILSQLQQLISEEMIENSQIKLSQQWQERMRELGNQVQAFSLVAFYGLDKNTLENYSEALQSLDPEEMIPIAQQALQIEQQFSILQPPQS